MEAKTWKKIKNIWERLRMKFLITLRGSGKMTVVSKTFTKGENTITIMRTWDSQGIMAKRMEMNGKMGCWCPMYDKPLRKHQVHMSKKILEADLERDAEKFIKDGWLWLE